ncbi:MAG TPA: IPT/TIG domain-containing protein [Candidatus Limnocylindrales bacterium]|nr:IPT/TIG domain-containing protein [Candidatus Limnocylindrales bacterium]
MRKLRFLRCVPLFALLVLLAPAAFGQAAPVITSLNPPNATVGGAGFTLTVNGMNFINTSVVRVNGANRATTFLGATQLQTAIMAADIAAPGNLTITVFTPVVGVPGGGFTSNAALLTVAAVLPPTLTTVAPGFTAQGASQMRMTLMGANFRPGATVVISPPIASVSLSTANQPAADIFVDQVSVISGNLIVATISVSGIATPALRAVDVVNSDGTSTGVTPLGAPGTSQPLRITLSNSLGAPLSVSTIALTAPRNGTLVMQGDELYGEAQLAGTGSGTVIGAWLWDGNVVEQFTGTFSGGESVTIRSLHSFPTSFLGTHTVELRILSPNHVATRPVTVVVNPGDFKSQVLLAPPSGAHADVATPPQFRWAPVPGAAKYQIGFSSQPYFSTIDTWYDSADNQWTPSSDIWDRIPDGQVFWTVRAVEISGEARKPVPMRSLFRFPANALVASGARPSVTPHGSQQLEWNGLRGHYFYLITISSDSAGVQIVRRYLSALPKIDLRALKGKLDPATTYYWRVDALTPDGQTILTGPTQSFTPLPPGASGPSSREIPPATEPAVAARFNGPGLVLASLHSDAAFASSSAEAPPADISTLSGRTPAPDATVTSPKAPIVLQFSTAPNAFDLSIQVDSTDVTSLAEVADTKVTYTPALALADGDHTINVTLGSDSTTWKFTVKAGAASAATGSGASGTDAEASGTGAGAGAAQAAKRTETANPRVQMQTQISSNTEWDSGSNPDTNALAFAQQMSYQQGKWNVQMNGSGLLNTTFNPEFERTSLGDVNNYVLQTGVQGSQWGLNLRFGIIAPALYLNSQFVTTGTPMQGVETMMKTPAGTFGFYANTNDQAPGGGFGLAFHQQMMGASWDLPLPKKYVEFRLMWLSAKDIGAPTTVELDSQGNPITLENPIAPVSGGDVYGAILLVHLSQRWLWSSEYAWSYDNPDIVAGSGHLFGRAWRTGVTGQIGKASLNVGYIDVGPNFGSPANPSLSYGSNPDRRGPNATLILPTAIGNFSFSEQYLQSNYHDADFPEQEMNSLTEGWSKNLNPKTMLSFTSHQTLTDTGTIPTDVKALPPDEQLALEADQQDFGGNLSLTRQVGKVMLSLGGSRDWFRNNLITGNNSITSSVLVGGTWNYATFFQLNANVSVNWVAADKSTIGTTRSLSGYLQPTFIWKRAGFQVQPLASYNQTLTQLGTGIYTNNFNTGQYGGRLSWTMPGEFKFSTLSFEGDYTINRSPLLNFDMRGTTALLVWTIVWGHHQAI